MHLIGVGRQSDQRTIVASEQAQLIRATELEREILRVEDSCYELLTRMTKLTKIAITARLEALREAQETLLAQIASVRRAGKLDEIYCKALDQRMATLVFLVEKTRRKALAR